MDNPREGDNLGHMICFHRRYNLGDPHSMTPEGLAEILKRPDVVSLPCYLYDHTTLAMRTCHNGDAWDVGLVGAIYATRAEIRQWYGVKRCTERIRRRAQVEMMQEVADYSRYIGGYEE